MNAITLHTAPTYEVADIWKMAQAVAASGLFGMKRPEEAMSLMLIAQADGIHPAAAARDYHIVDGRPTLKADAMLARFIAAGGKVEWHAYTDEKVDATFSHPQGGSVRLDWTLERAKKITRKSKPITEGDNWRNYPRAMLRARVISEGIRTVYPGVAVGIYTPEEVQDFDDGREPRNVTPARQETVTVVETKPEPAEPSGVVIACRAAIDLCQTKADCDRWAADNEASLAKIKATSQADYDAVLTYWKAKRKALPRDLPTEGQAPPADDAFPGDIIEHDSTAEFS